MAAKYKTILAIEEIDAPGHYRLERNENLKMSVYHSDKTGNWDAAYSTNNGRTWQPVPKAHKRLAGVLKALNMVFLFD